MGILLTLMCHLHCEDPASPLTPGVERIDHTESYHAQSRPGMPMDLRPWALSLFEKGYGTLEFFDQLRCATLGLCLFEGIGQ